MSVQLNGLLLTFIGNVERLENISLKLFKDSSTESSIKVRTAINFKYERRVITLTEEI